MSKVVGREGFEPSKAFSQRIYSPLHLTTLVPPHYSRISSFVSRISYLLACSVLSWIFVYPLSFFVNKGGDLSAPLSFGFDKSNPYTSIIIIHISFLFTRYDSRFTRYYFIILEPMIRFERMTC